MTSEAMRWLAGQRSRRGLTQVEVARRMGCSQPHVHRLESGRLDPRLSTVLRYLDVVLGQEPVVQIAYALLRRPA